jgi:hypothetical protein
MRQGCSRDCGVVDGISTGRRVRGELPGAGVTSDPWVGRMGLEPMTDGL